jgi:hypothetical protein
MPNGTLPFERVASIAFLVLIQRRKSGNRGRMRHRRPVDIACWKRNSEHCCPAPNSFGAGPSSGRLLHTVPKTATSSRWMILFLFSRCRQGPIFSEFRSPRPVAEIPRIVAAHWSLCQRSQAESSMDRHDRCIPNSIRILGGRTREGRGSVRKADCCVGRIESVGLCDAGGQTRNFGPRHCGIIVGPSLSGCSWRAFTTWHFIVVISAQQGCAKDGKAELPGKDSSATGRNTCGGVSLRSYEGVDSGQYKSV